MKKRLLAFISATAIAAVLNVSPAYTQSSQTMRVEVPFAFTTSSTTLPAGTYLVEPAGNSRVVWRIRDTSHRTSVFLLALTLAGSSPDDPQLTFHRYGDTHFLAGFTTAAYQVQLPVSKSEKARRSSLEPLAKMNVVGVEAKSGGSR